MRTRRQRIIEQLGAGPTTVRQLAAELGVPIRDVVSDLEHVARSLRGQLDVEPARCCSCGMVFRRRRRFTAPSRCPRCRSEETTEPQLLLRGERSRQVKR